MPKFADVVNELAKGNRQRLLAFGSSNTGRRVDGMHWFDCLDLSLKRAHGNRHRCINAGVGGENALNLLDRFEEDAAFYKPHAVFITVGGNDAAPKNDHSHEMFKENLLELHRRFAAMNTAVIFQTYYAANVYQDGMTPYLKKFYEFMEIVREVVKETGAELVDHLARWEPFRLEHPDKYIELMHDVMHVNEQGNLVLGLDIVRQFNLSLFNENFAYWSFARQCQALMDAIAARNA